MPVINLQKSIRHKERSEHTYYLYVCVRGGPNQLFNHRHHQCLSSLLRDFHKIDRTSSGLYYSFGFAMFFEFTDGVPSYAGF
jgi:hypothetical protein